MRTLFSGGKAPGWRACLAAALLLLCCGVCRAQPARAAEPAAAAPPAIPEHVLFRPTFVSPDFAHYAGLAFRLGHGEDGRQYLVTAHSLFGPAADLDVQMSDEDIERMIVAAVGVSCTDPRSVVMARRHVRVPGARRADERGAEKDLALFELPARMGSRALALDETPPMRGDRAWLQMKYAGTGRTGFEPVVIAWVSDKELRYLLQNQEADLRGTTGAPIISTEGKVIGMHLGVFASGTGRKFGYACPAGAIRAVLEPGRPAESPPTVLRER